MVDTSLIWAVVIGFAVMMYIILDGFDLGIGILFPWVKDHHERDLMMNSIAPYWDGNETWLVMGGSSLLAAFPKAYAMLLSTLYLPLMLFLVALILRGVAFEFRFKSSRYRWLWDGTFTVGSSVATFMQGIVLGSFVQGLPAQNVKIIHENFAWFTPFTLTIGVALLVGYSLLGATWLIIKTEGELQAWCRRIGRRLLIAMLGFIVIVSIWTPLLQPAIAEIWFSWPDMAFLSPVPLHTAILSAFLWWSLRTRYEWIPFLCTIGLFFLAYTGFIISLWPYVVPRIMTIWEAAAPPESQIFALVGVLFLIPMILAYTFHTYWVFRGKVSAGYEH